MIATLPERRPALTMAAMTIVGFDTQLKMTIAVLLAHRLTLEVLTLFSLSLI